ncbi:hypothetical protein PFISCL1PPCAC_14940 [Pristionchus fissidentatus]|uniref:glucuronosyltransferase n=1 Tax=Pristionchus fissidentatus TaxID=1538716 RepID=A0AAV5VW58_9BILA|nr:hypothetical protein PFISCL1PPCAC_14940 [Pristionchus fissidentatus]
MRLRVCSLLLLFMIGSIGGETIEGSSKEKRNENGHKNVLIYNPYLGHYHMKFMSTIANEMHNAGYNVTVINSIVDKKQKAVHLEEGITEIFVEQHFISNQIIENGDKKDNGLRAFWDELPLNQQMWSTFGHYWPSNNFSYLLTSQCENVLNSTNCSVLNDVKFDLAITEVFDLCGLGLFHKLNPDRVILASSIPLHDYFGEKLGLPRAFDLVPPKYSLKLLSDHKESFKFTTAGIIQSAIESSLWGANMFGSMEKNETKLFMKNDSTFPGFEILLRRAHSLIENVHPLIDLSKPTLNAIVPIGGITVDPKKELNESLLSLLRSAETSGNKRILVSFGTVMDPKYMAIPTRDNVLKAMGNVKNATFFWKAGEELMKKVNGRKIELPANVHAFEWLPQNDLLASGLIDLFVSHMGIGSLTEASYHGVPLVSVPIFVDQPYNTVCAIRLGISRYVNKLSLAWTSNELEKAIKKALADEKAKSASQQLSRNLRSFGDQRKKMMEHIEFVMSLPPKSTSMSFFNHHHGIKFASTVVPLLAYFLTVYLAHVAVFASFFSFAVVFRLRDLHGPSFFFPLAIDSFWMSYLFTKCIIHVDNCVAAFFDRYFIVADGCVSTIAVLFFGPAAAIWFLYISGAYAMGKFGCGNGNNGGRMNGNINGNGAALNDRQKKEKAEKERKELEEKISVFHYFLIYRLCKRYCPRDWFSVAASLIVPPAIFIARMYF